MLRYFLYWIRAIALLILAVIAMLAIERICFGDGSAPSVLAIPKVSPEVMKGCAVLRCDIPKCPSCRAQKQKTRVVVKEIPVDRVVYKDVFLPKKNTFSILVGRGHHGISTQMENDEDVTLKRNYGYSVGLRYDRVLFSAFSGSIEAFSNGFGSVGFGYSW